jgi:hypothetical protein
MGHLLSSPSGLVGDLVFIPFWIYPKGHHGPPGARGNDIIHCPTALRALKVKGEK